MGQTKQKRDNKYFLERLRVEHPDVHADFQAGGFKNLHEALVKAGLRKPRSSLDALKAAWKKASMSERDAFKKSIGCATPATTGTPASTSAPAKPSHRVASPGSGKRHLPPGLETAVREIMDRRGMKNGDVMSEIGRDPLDTSLAMAFSQGFRIQERMIEDLEAWVVKNKAP
ncbi:MAG: hypothetical protein LC676_18855 [Loktanella sp.]|nr:hypothetical protein [Loktanella sp.]